MQPYWRSSFALVCIISSLAAISSATPTPSSDIYARSSKLGFNQVFPSAPLPPPNGLDPVAPIEQNATAPA